MIIFNTKRLYLRQFEQGDLYSLHSIFSDVETMEYYPAPFTLEQTQNWIKRNQERYVEDYFGLWGICLKGNDELIGDCGLVKHIVDGKIEIEIGLSYQ